MTLYLVNPNRVALPAAQAGRVGFLATPKQGNIIPPGVAWAADNGCGPTKKDGAAGASCPDGPQFLAYLAKLADRAPDALFAVAPDVLGDARATLERSAPVLPQIRALGYPAALVAQDGLELILDEVPWDDVDVIFIGGSTEWKLGAGARLVIAEAKRHGKRVHFGRVNSNKRLRYAASIGADSVDGTYITYAPTVNTARLLGWVDQLEADPPARYDFALAA